ncbi:MAG: hypothetical protein HC896_00770 [Bacteroidales bacterium]|nr:hypothetical protein [Bacteroidales bacterium]
MPKILIIWCFCMCSIGAPCAKPKLVKPLKNNSRVSINGISSEWGYADSLCFFEKTGR